MSVNAVIWTRVQQSDGSYDYHCYGATASTLYASADNATADLNTLLSEYPTAEGMVCAVEGIEGADPDAAQILPDPWRRA